MTDISEAHELAGQWFRIIKRQPDPHTRLVCFPHAGGAASFFRMWADLMPEGVELIAVRYPGREDRLCDPLVDTMEGLADPITQACSALRGAPLAFFGHSMGAAVAHEVALRLRSPRATRVTGLFVSGYPGPGQETRVRDHAGLSDLELIKDLELLGGTDSKAFEDAGLRELLLPAIRADYRLIEHHKAPSVNAVIEAPIVAYYGNQDEDAHAASVSAWSAVTKSTFTARSFDGGHFYLTDHAPALVADLLGHLTYRQAGAPDRTTP
jgi:pyochelin biosynthetic protein PchC